MAEVLNVDRNNAQEIMAMLQLVDIDWRADEVAGLLESFAYQGFDPEKMYKALFKKAQALHPRVPGVALPTYINEVRDALNNDLKTAAIIVVARGTNITKVASGKTQAAGQRAAGELRTKYSIADKCGADSGPAVVTLARMSALVPAHVVRGVHLSQVPTVVSNMPAGTPRGMLCPAFGAVIPAGALYSSLKGAYLWHQVLFDEVVNSKTGRYSTPQVLEQFQTIQAGSRMFTDDYRRRCLAEIGVLEMTQGVPAVPAAPGHLAVVAVPPTMVVPHAINPNLVPVLARGSLLYNAWKALNGRERSEEVMRANP